MSSVVNEKMFFGYGVRAGRNRWLEYGSALPLAGAACLPVSGRAFLQEITRVPDTFFRGRLLQGRTKINSDHFGRQPRGLGHLAGITGGCGDEGLWGPAGEEISARSLGIGADEPEGGVGLKLAAERLGIRGAGEDEPGAVGIGEVIFIAHVPGAGGCPGVGVVEDK